MGVSSTSPTLSRPDTFVERDRLVVAGAYAAAAAAAAAAVALAVALIAYGWKDVVWALSAPGSQGVLHALGTTGIIVLIALPVTVLIGLLAVAAVTDANIGGFAGVAVRESIEWSSGIPPVVIGVAVFLCAVEARQQNAYAAATFALVLLNLPNAAARLTHAFSSVPREAREAAAALGASPVAAYFGLLQPAAAWAAISAILALAAQMTGETSAVAVAMSMSDGPQPLSVQIWRFASNTAMAGIEAASCIVLVLAVGVLLALSRVCSRRHIEASSPP
jgi:ABC-type phosphate transport system permease subunit